MKGRKPTGMLLSGILMILFAAPSAWSKAGDSFQERKTEALSEIEERTQKLQEHKNCVDSASSVDALKQCRKAMKERHKADRVERLARRKARIDERMKKLQEKKE